MKQEMRANILDIAANDLEHSGGANLTVRYLAERANTSTQAIYTQFGGKQGLITALYQEGWDRLSETLGNLEQEEHPLEQLIRIGLAYTDFATRNPYFYHFMIGRTLANVMVDQEQVRHSDVWQRFTAKAVRRAIKLGYLQGSANEIGYIIWSLAHGMIELSDNGFIRPRVNEKIIRKSALGIFLAFQGPKFTSPGNPTESWKL